MTRISDHRANRRRIRRHRRRIRCHHRRSRSIGERPRLIRPLSKTERSSTEIHANHGIIRKRKWQILSVIPLLILINKDCVRRRYVNLSVFESKQITISLIGMCPEHCLIAVTEKRHRQRRHCVFRRRSHRHRHRHQRVVQHRSRRPRRLRRWCIDIDLVIDLVIAGASHRSPS